MENRAPPSMKCSIMAEKKKQGNDDGLMQQKEAVVQHRREIKLII